MAAHESKDPGKVAFITGASKRIGAAVARELHHQGYRIVLHYGTSVDEAEGLAKSLNNTRPDSAACLQADLNDHAQVELLAERAFSCFGQMDVLINNASTFYPTPIGAGSAEQWEELFNSNAKAPFFLSQALAPALRESRGCIINMADIHADRPLTEHTIYCMAKAANVMLTKSLAKELAPHVRVNGIAPGAILWPEEGAEPSGQQKESILGKVPLAKPGHPNNIAQAVSYLISPDNYVTGQILSVDGGRSISG
jgi:pteridine reductase